MCCLRYEHEFYVQSRKRFPKEGKIITTAKGEEKVMLNDIFHDRVTLRAPDGETRIITLVDLRRETSGWTPGPTDEYSVSDARDAAEEGEVAFDDTPTMPERTRVPASDRTLPVLPATPSVPSAPPAPRAKTPVAAPVVADAPIAEPLEDVDVDDDGEEELDDNATTTADGVAGEAPKRRRRRGRRGGRRGRGNRPPTGDDTPAQ
jgi:hypothetical protein